MSDQVLMEEPLQFGEGGRLLGILTSPSMPARNAEEVPVFVFLSAGSLHRVGPHRLHVRLSRELAQMGFSSLRVDLSGTGDSPPHPGLTNQQSVAADFAEILAVLESRLGRLPLVLAGLCSGADDAIRLTLTEPRVVGMVLLDPVCFLDRGFRLRVAVAKYTNPARYIAWLRRRFKALMSSRAKKQENDESVDPLTFRDLPTREQLRGSFEAVRERGGRVLSVFTDYAHGYYNKSGQLRRVLGVNGYQQFCSELFWQHVDHTYRLELHRCRVIEEIKTWAGGYIHS
jgi:pimeloyl-ACP methyl ester carboxylesterase